MRDEIVMTYREVVRRAIEDVVKEFRERPASFLYEADIQGLLFARLFDGLNVRGSLLSWPLGAAWNGVGKGPPHFVNPVKSEYPDGTLFDVAVLDQDTDKNLNVWNQRVRVGIEVKLWQADGAGGSFERDLEKLNDYAKRFANDRRGFTGLSLVFCHKRDESRLKGLSVNPPILVNPTSLEVPEDAVVAWAFKQPE